MKVRTSEIEGYNEYCKVIIDWACLDKMHMSFVVMAYANALLISFVDIHKKIRERLLSLDCDDND